jgi:FixJ family two-component response regulator
VSTTSNVLISIVDDDESIREAIEGLIESLGLRAHAFSSARDFLASPHIGATSCMIADVHMPQMSGVELHRRLTELGHPIPTILITAYPNDGVRARALADGVICYLSKPFADDALIGAVRSALQGAKPGAEG